MNAIAEILIVPATRTFAYGERLLAGITPEIAARKPQGFRDGKPSTIDTNHPLFVFGHLAIYPQRLWTLRGLDPGDLAPSAAWMDLFKAGAPCHDDPAGTIYPKWDEVVSRYRRGYQHVLETLPTIPDEVFLREHPDPAMRATFARMGQAWAFIFCSHPMMHFGQVSAWRRCFGLSAAM